jgi:hypothetical protein
MGKTEHLQIRALGYCRFGRREFDKRFIRDLDSTLRRGRLHDLTNRQRYTLAKIAWRYRRQLAQRLEPDMIPDHEPRHGEYGLDQCDEQIPDLFTGELSPPLAQSPD